MTQRWRLIDGKELYDMDKDPGQTTDVASKHPEVKAELRSDYDGAIPPGKPVPGLEAFRETPGKSIKLKSATIKVGDQSFEKQVTGGEGTTFDMVLPQGETFIEAFFMTADDEQLGAYYVVVEKV